MRKATTLLELLMVLVVIGLLLLLARPALAGLIDRAAVMSATSEVVAVIGAARHSAIMLGKVVAVRFDSSGARVTVFAAADTLQRRDLRSAHRVTLATSRDSIAFHPNGRGYGAANATVVLRRGHAADTVLISRLGRVRH